MEYLSLFGMILVIHLLAVMSPGPDFVMVLKNALQYDKKTAIYTSLGISMGIAVHILYSVGGVAYLLQHNTKVFAIVKIMGAIYIMYIGWKTLRTPLKKIDITTAKSLQKLSPKAAFKIGFLTNVLNPKASLFFLSLFSLVIPQNTPFWTLIVISLMLIGVTFLWFTLVSYIFTSKTTVTIYEQYEPVLLKVFGIVLILLGIAIFFEI